MFDFRELLEIIVLIAIAVEVYVLERHARLERKIDQHIDLLDRHMKQLDEHIAKFDEHQKIRLEQNLSAEKSDRRT